MPNALYLVMRLARRTLIIGALMIGSVYGIVGLGYGMTKYNALGIEFPLSDYDECADAAIQKLYQTIEDCRKERS